MKVLSNTHLTALALLALLARQAYGQTPAPPPSSLKAQSTGRLHVPLQVDWRFYKGSAPGAEAVAFADDAWQPVVLPHTWNAFDGQDGGNNYYKGDGWYRRHVTVTDAMKGKSLFLRFEAINRKADIYVNGKLLGSHAGGQAAICLDATAALRPGDNVLAVRASNRIDQDMPPISADFTFFGGIYRPAELIAVNPVHFALTDFASSGVYVTTPDVSEAKATVHVRARIEGLADGAAASVDVELLDADGKTAARASAGRLPSANDAEVAVDLTVANPHLWNGHPDPYCYTVKLTLTPGSAKAGADDVVTQRVGIRTFSVDPTKGFILNGKPYGLHGVNRHQDRLDQGWALSEADHLQDMALIKEMGCTAVRLAHYQHAQFFYDLCDREGMVVWAEIPVVNKIGRGDFTANARQQYTELIRQSFNHPSICFWSAGNEVNPGRATTAPDGDVNSWFRSMSALAKQEDPFRLTAVAWREVVLPRSDVSDVFGINQYFGWYDHDNGWEKLDDVIAKHSRGAAKGKWAVSEYGAGGSIHFHSETPVRMDHTEEYQAVYHENTWKVLDRHPEIWGKFVWNMFDFAADMRAEGDHAGINNKGMVTYDRQSRKDVFYFYKAVWASEPSLWITGKRFAVRGVSKIPVKVYTNAPTAALTVNGVAAGEKAVENGTIVWKDVTLKEGRNDVRVTGVFGNGIKLEDGCRWDYTPGAPTEIYDAQDGRMKDALKRGPPQSNKTLDSGAPAKPSTQ